MNQNKETHGDKALVDCRVEREKDNERYDGVEQQMKPHNIDLDKNVILKSCVQARPYAYCDVSSIASKISKLNCWNCGKADNFKWNAVLYKKLNGSLTSL